MTGHALGRVYTHIGSFLYTSRHVKKSLLPWRNRDLFVGVWENSWHVPTLLSPRGDYVVETFFTPRDIEIDSRSLEGKEI